MPKTEVSKDRAALLLNRRMQELARKQLELDRRQADFNSRLEALRSHEAGPIETLQRTVSRLRGKIEGVCREHRALLMPDSVKSLQTPQGRVGFRSTGVQIEVLENDGHVCGELRRRRLGHLIRVQECPDRPAIKRAMETGELDSRILTACGIEVGGPQESFYCILNGAH